jgi:hypothetical protein
LGQTYNPASGRVHEPLENAMKTTLFAFLLLCASAAFGQAASVISSEPSPIQIPSHTQRATQHFMQREASLMITTDPNSARGERPLWEVGAKPVEIPLGDIARMLRTEHATAPKAVKTLVK